MDISGKTDPARELPESGKYEWSPDLGLLSTRDREIRYAIDRQLLEHGFRHIEHDENPDILVSYKTYTEQKIADNDFEFAFLGADEPVVQYAEPGPAAFPFSQETLIVRVKDRNGFEPLWEGVGAGIVRKPGPSALQINDSVARIFRMFPVQRLARRVSDSSSAPLSATPAGRNERETG